MFLEIVLLLKVLSYQILLLSTWFSGRKQIFNFKDPPVAKNPQCSYCDNSKRQRGNPEITGYDRNKLEMFPISRSICGFVIYV